MRRKQPAPGEPQQQEIWDMPAERVSLRDLADRLGTTTMGVLGGVSEGRIPGPDFRDGQRMYWLRETAEYLATRHPLPILTYEPRGISPQYREHLEAVRRAHKLRREEALREAHERAAAAPPAEIPAGDVAENDYRDDRPRLIDLPEYTDQVEDLDDQVEDLEQPTKPTRSRASTKRPSKPRPPKKPAADVVADLKKAGKVKTGKQLLDQQEDTRRRMGKKG